jgi:Holliday junction DNA helicase RuvA
VSGVGPKSAIAVLSVLGGDGVLSGCARGDAEVFTRVPGIGKKLAQRIALELPDRLKKVSVEFMPDEGAAAASAGGPESEACVALEPWVLPGRIAVRGRGGAAREGAEVRRTRCSGRRCGAFPEAGMTRRGRADSRRESGRQDP